MRLRRILQFVRGPVQGSESGGGLHRGGASRGFGFVPGEKLESTHSWNAVKIDDAWQLVDATWGAGSLTTKDKKEPGPIFVKRFNGHYFLDAAGVDGVQPLSG